MSRHVIIGLYCPQGKVCSTTDLDGISKVATSTAVQSKEKEKT